MFFNRRIADNNNVLNVYKSAIGLLWVTKNTEVDNEYIITNLLYFQLKTNPNNVYSAQRKLKETQTLFIDQSIQQIIYLMIIQTKLIEN